jgi:hypothetical protein
VRIRIAISAIDASAIPVAVAVGFARRDASIAIVVEPVADFGGARDLCRIGIVAVHTLIRPVAVPVDGLVAHAIAVVVRAIADDLRSPRIGRYHRIAAVCIDG